MRALGNQQVLGFDQYEALYRNYSVIGWKATVKVVHVGTDNAVPVVFGMSVRTDATALTSYQHYIEGGNTRYATMTPDVDHATIVMKGGVKKYLLPRGGKMLTDPECYAAMNDTPFKQLFLHVWCQVITGIGDAASNVAVVSLKQRYVFFDKITPARSTHA